MLSCVKIIKYRHSCVRLEFDNGTVLVIDPGTWSEAHALLGADAVLVTHEHNDHVDELRLAGLNAPVFAPSGADIGAIVTTRVDRDQEFTVAGIPVRAVGGRHATVHDGEPDCVNFGYVVDNSLYHPGDALALPEQSIESLLIPMQGAWLKTTEAIKFAEAIGPERACGIHDEQINVRGRNSINGWLSKAVADYRWVPPGETW
jgi:L-ascorbate metabolism protein UlaG (beta-lactamase superfamily)